MAERGGQPGNDNATKSKPWRAAIERALAQDNGKKLRAIAEKLLEAAANGEGWAIKELGDRIDGKSIQPIAAEVDANLNVTVKQFTLPK